MRCAVGERPTVSIIIPALNAAPSINRAVESVTAQRDCSLEVIVVDNGSVDGTCDVVRDISRTDSRVCLIESGPTGVSHARNAGIDAAKGDYIVFCDADDEMERGALSLLLDYSEGVDVVAGGVSFDTVDTRGKVVTSSPRQLKTPVFARKAGLGELFEDLWADNYLQGCWSKIYSAEFIRKSGVRFNERLSSYEDLAFVLDCLSHGASFKAIPDICYRYRRSTSETNSTRYKPDMTDQMRRVSELLVEFYTNVLGRGGDPSCAGHVIRMLTIAVNNAQKSPGGTRAAKEAVADIFVQPVFRDAALSAAVYPNKYSHLLVRLGIWKRYGSIVLLAKLRNWIRSIRVAG